MFQEAESWKAKYEELKRQTDAQGDVAAQYEQLKAQYEALANVAAPEQEKCQVRKVFSDPFGALRL